MKCLFYFLVQLVTVVDPNLCADFSALLAVIVNKINTVNDLSVYRLSSVAYYDIFRSAARVPGVNGAQAPRPLALGWSSWNARIVGSP